MLQRLAMLFVFGATAITFFDGFHTYSGTTEYAHLWILRMAWWTPLLFGSTVAFGGWIYAEGYRRLGGPERLATWGELASAFVLFGLLYFASGYLPVSNAAKLLVLVAGAAVVWRVVDRSRQGIMLAVFNAMAGCATEMVLTHFGAFRHLQADLLGIPIWLPGLYLAAGPALGQLARKVYESGGSQPVLSRS